jgi:hypothetical protein
LELLLANNKNPFNNIVIERKELIIMSCITGKTCVKLTGNLKKDTSICASCRDVLKVDMARIILEMDPIYLHEGNRNNSGRPHKLTPTEQHDIKYAHRNGQSMGSLSRKYGVSKTTIFNIVN